MRAVNLWSKVLHLYDYARMNVKEWNKNAYVIKKWKRTLLLLQNTFRTGFCNCSFRSMMWLRSAVLHEEVMTDSTINVWYSILVENVFGKYVIFVLNIYIKTRHMYYYISKLHTNWNGLQKINATIKVLVSKLLRSSFDVLSGIGMKHDTFNSHIKFCCQ